MIGEPSLKGGSEASAFEVRLKRGLLAGPHNPQSTAEKRRYPGGKLPMSVHGSKVATPVNCDQPPLKLLTKVARDTNKGSQN